MRELETYQQVRIILEAAFGPDLMDYDRVTDIIDGYAEPGYRDAQGRHETAVVVLGDWNPKRWPRDGEPELTKKERIGPRLADMLERAGASIEWYDEWQKCQGCYRAVRSQSNSYSWREYGAWDEESGKFLCADCLRDDMETSVEQYVNEPRRCITWLDDGTELAAIGFQQWKPADPQRYESGWHPGQTDDPETVLDEIRAASDDPDHIQVVFLLDEASQFYVGWSAWVRIDDNDNE